jgi:hypothetical protein
MGRAVSKAREQWPAHAPVPLPDHRDKTHSSGPADAIPEGRHNAWWSLSVSARTGSDMAGLQTLPPGTLTLPRALAGAAIGDSNPDGAIRVLASYLAWIEEHLIGEHLSSWHGRWLERRAGDQLEWHWQHQLRPGLNGLTDDEYFGSRLPAAGASAAAARARRNLSRAAEFTPPKERCASSMTRTTHGSAVCAASAQQDLPGRKARRSRPNTRMRRWPNSSSPSTWRSPTTVRRYACFVTCICGTTGEMACEFQVAATALSGMVRPD